MALPDAPRLLVIRVARYGDTLMITPALAALKKRWPRAHLTVLAHPKRKEVLEALPMIDRLGTITKHRARWRGWLARGKHRPFDAAIVYGDDDALFAYARRVSDAVIGLEPRATDRPRPLTHAVPRPDASRHAFVDDAALLAPLGIATDDLHLRYAITAAERAGAAELVASRGWSGRRLVGLQLQSFPTKAYRDWPPEHFVALGRRLLEREADLQILVLGGPESRALATRVAAALGPRAASLAGTLSIRETAAGMAQLSLYVGVDTGPTHVAGALDVPMVALYHPLHPARRYAPQGHPAATAIDHPSAEGDRDARLADIDVQRVFDAACARLDATAASADRAKA